MRSDEYTSGEKLGSWQTGWGTNNQRLPAPQSDAERTIEDGLGRPKKSLLPVEIEPVELSADDQADTVAEGAADGKQVEYKHDGMT